MALVEWHFLMVKAVDPPELTASLLIPLALVAFAALPVYAFYEGHPFRIRYMIPAAAAWPSSAAWRSAACAGEPR